MTDSLPHLRIPELTAAVCQYNREENREVIGVAETGLQRIEMKM